LRGLNAVMVKQARNGRWPLVTCYQCDMLCSGLQIMAVEEGSHSTDKGKQVLWNKNGNFNKTISFMLYSEINLYSTVRLFFSLQWKIQLLCLHDSDVFCTLAHFNKPNVTFIKLGTNDVDMMTSWRCCFPRYNIFVCFSLKETKNMLNFWCKIKIISWVIVESNIFTSGLASSEDTFFYYHEWNKFLSYTNIQQIFSI